MSKNENIKNDNGVLSNINKIIKYVVNTSLFLLIVITGYMITGCQKGPAIDAEKCAEMALEYLEEKYQTEFVLEDTYVVGGLSGSWYTNVLVYLKDDAEQYRYTVEVVPDGKVDEDGDGYCDSYKIRSDTYMNELLRQFAKNDMDKLLEEAGFSRFISRVSLGQRGVIEFLPDFPIISEEEFSLDKLLDDYQLVVHCRLEIPESEYMDNIEEVIEEKFRPLISNDIIYFSIAVYSEESYKDREELYKEREELYKDTTTAAVVGNKNIRIVIEQED